MTFNFNSQTYFEDIGAWPREGGHLLYMYGIGFLFSLLTTGAAFYITIAHTLPLQQTVLFLFALAFAQLLIQLICFLHLGAESSSRSRLLAFAFAVLVTLILITGSLWIMNNLNTRMTSDPAAMQQYMQNEGGF